MFRIKGNSFVSRSEHCLWQAKLLRQHAVNWRKLISCCQGKMVADVLKIWNRN
uniref:Uncharacterized protein n=1 Tax=Arundo donax TaxID=35708 RepID=A0A0A9CQK2_ARUDO